MCTGLTFWTTLWLTAQQRKSAQFLNVTYEADAWAQPRLKCWGGPRFGSQHRGACTPRPKAGLVLGTRGGRPPSGYESPRVSSPEIFGKLRCWILHSGDNLLWNCLLFENYGQEVMGQYVIGPHSLPGPTVVVPMRSSENCITDTGCVRKKIPTSQYCFRYVRAGGLVRETTLQPARVVTPGEWKWVRQLTAQRRSLSVPASSRNNGRAVSVNTASSQQSGMSSIALRLHRKRK